MATQKNNGGAGKVGLGLGLAAAAVAGAYYLYGSKEGAKRRTAIKGWSLRAKGEVLEKIENLKEVNQEAYDKIVDAVTEKYEKAKGIDMAEVAALATDLKKHWKNISSQISKGGASKKPAAKGSKAKKAPKAK